MNPIPSSFTETVTDSSIKSPTILFIPRIQYPDGYDIEVSGGEIDKRVDKQLVFINIKHDGVHRVNITKVVKADFTKKT